jgi:hypothetical protein
MIVDINNVYFIVGNGRSAIGIRTDDPTEYTDDDFVKCILVGDQRTGVDTVYLRDCTVCPYWVGEVYNRWWQRYYRVRRFFSDIVWYTVKLPYRMLFT